MLVTVRKWAPDHCKGEKKVNMLTYNIYKINLKRKWHTDPTRTFFGEFTHTGMRKNFV